MMKCVSVLTAFAAASLVLASAAAAHAADAAGTWKWKFTTQNGQEIEFTLSLKQEGDKLTGTLARGASGRSSEISDGAIKGGEVSFTTVVERNGNNFTTKYKGKVDGDTIKGTTERERNGQAVTRDWEAKREKK
jgi:hypothetical protein